jgi:hypothetical protein
LLRAAPTTSGPRGSRGGDSSHPNQYCQLLIQANRPQISFARPLLTIFSDKIASSASVPSPFSVGGRGGASCSKASAPSQRAHCIPLPASRFRRSTPHTALPKTELKSALLACWQHAQLNATYSNAAPRILLDIPCDPHRRILRIGYENLCLPAICYIDKSTHVLL